MNLYHVTFSFEAREWVVLAESDEHAIKKVVSALGEVPNNYDTGAFEAEKLHGMIVEVSASPKLDAY